MSRAIRPLRAYDLFAVQRGGGGWTRWRALLAQRLSEVWGSRSSSRTRRGAAGNVGAYQAANGRPDGYTLTARRFMTYMSIIRRSIITPAYNPFTDRAADQLLLFCSFPTSIWCPLHRRPIRVREFIDLRQGQPGAGVTFASTVSARRRI